MASRTPRAVVRIQIRLLKLAQNSKSGDSGREGRFSLSVGMVTDKIAVKVFGHSVDPFLQILNMGFHSFLTNSIMISQVGGRGFLFMVCQVLG